MKLHLLSVFALTGLSLALLGACSEQFADCDEDETCLDSENGNTTDSGDGDTGSGGSESGDGDGDGDTSSGGNGNAGGGADGSGGELIDPCDVCEGDTPACKEKDEEKSCVECTDHNLTACAQPGEFCSPDNKCVECLDNTQCTKPDASVCDLTSETDPNTCTGCVEHTDCEHLTDTPACDTETNTCVACTIDTEAEQCGEFSCSSLTHTCTTTKVGLRDTCEPCESDSECAVDRKCVMDQFQGEDVGYFCFLEQAAIGCGDAVEARRPYRSVMELTSIDGEQAQNFCLPPNATTCQGIKDTQSIACTTDTECGLDDLDDGYCPTAGDGAGLCTYKCGGGVDCASPSLECGGSPLHCNPAP